ncbi:DUF805 domain-containing protein [Salipiger sp. P9]|uniref:DUF805 domain-containing protein n=1 Tax=Salipiger pentaromativorans TaxID=2943193 RepID=UPI0021574446|nr:DUF805 domain-containing protein [Salipiger pentaromativorans]MCR8547664.1 DUF805 domain-containing protein [Salipiger pentaromativorans]
MYGPIAACESYVFNAFTLAGRASRSEYWWPTLFVGVLTLAAGVADAVTVFRAMNGSGAISTSLLSYWSPLVSLLTVVPGFTSAIRRLHDTGRSGFWALVVVIPMVGWLIYMVLLALPSEARANDWGQPRVGPNAFGPRSARDTGDTPASKARGKRGHTPSAIDSYAVLLQSEAEPSPEEIARRRQEVHEYFMRNVSRRASA